MDPKEREHPLVRRARTAFKKAQPDTYGLVHCGPFPTLTVALTPEGLERGLRVLALLLRNLLASGFKLRLPGDDKDLGVLDVEGERFRLRLTEKVNRKPHKQTREDRELAVRRPWAARNWDYSGSGLLVFSVLELRSSYGPSFVSRESPNNRFDSDLFLSQIKPSLLELVGRLREYRLEQQRREEQRRREAVEWERRRRAREEEARRVQTLREEARAWAEAANLRAYVAATSETFAGSTGPDSLAHWLAWSMKVADAVDPLKNGAASGWFSEQSHGDGDQPD